MPMGFLDYRELINGDRVLEIVLGILVLIFVVITLIFGSLAEILGVDEGVSKINDEVLPEDEDFDFDIDDESEKEED